MEEKLMDKVISDALKEDIVLPDIINLKVDEALDNIVKGNEVEVKNRRFNNKFFKAAVVALVILGGGAIASTNQTIVSYAKTVIESVFKTMKDDRGINENFDKYSNKVVAEATDNDITIRVTDVFSDGITLKLGYTVNDKKFKERGENYTGSVCKGKIYIDGKEAQMSSGWANENNSEDNTFMVINSYKFKDRLPSKFNMKWKISNVCKVEGNWELNFQVNSEGLAKDSKIIEVNKEYKIGGCTYHLKDIRYTPTGNYIDIKVRVPKGADFIYVDGELANGLVVTDENGAIIQNINGMSSDDKGDYVEIIYEIGGIIDHMQTEYNIVPFKNECGGYKKLDISNMEKITVKVQQ